MGLTCITCGFDNFPFTNSENGTTARVVTHCHQCHSRITSECAVCRKLHPVGSTYCSLYGVNMQAFQAKQVQVKNLLAVFMMREDIQAIKTNTQSMIAKWIKILLGGLPLPVLLSIASFYTPHPVPLFVPIILLVCLTGLYLIASWMFLQGHLAYKAEREIARKWFEETRIDGISFTIYRVGELHFQISNFQHCDQSLITILQQNPA